MVGFTASRLLWRGVVRKVDDTVDSTVFLAGHAVQTLRLLEAKGLDFSKVSSSV